MENPEKEIISADKELRTKVLLGILLFSLAAAVLISAMASQVREITAIANLDPERALNNLKRLLILAASVNAATTIPLGAYFIWLALRILRHRRYPPQDMRVIRDTRLRTGRKAVRPALGCFMVSAMVFSTDFIFLYFYYILSGLIEG